MGYCFLDAEQTPNNNDVLVPVADEEINEFTGIILPSCVNLIKSELPLTRALNHNNLFGCFLFRQIYSPFNIKIQCLFCRNKWLPADLENHYEVIHKLDVKTSEAKFNKSWVFVSCTFKDKIKCKFCDTTLQTLSEVKLLLIHKQTCVIFLYIHICDNDLRNPRIIITCEYEQCGALNRRSCGY